MNQKSENVYQRGLGVRLRRTADGGAAFLPELGATVELDEEGFALLCWLSVPMTVRQLRQRFVRRFTRNSNLADIDCIVRRLEEYGFVKQVQGETMLSLLQGERAGVRVNSAYLSAQASEAVYCEPEAVPKAPESVHLQLNNVCNLRCPSCYVGLQREEDGLLSGERLIELVSEMAEGGVFQLALGGGEPLMSPNFVPVVQHAGRSGLLPNVTTNGWLLTRRLAAQIQGAIGEVRLSFNDGISICRELLAQKSALLSCEGIRFGFNVIVTRRNVQQLGEILRWLVALRPSSITLIRPKPAPHNNRWYAANALSAKDSILLVEQLQRIKALFEETLLTVDCAFSYLFRFYNLPDEDITARGVAGCAMGERFLVVAWNGDVYPCSHLRAEEFNVGNVQEQSLRVIWETAPLLARIRAELENLDGQCGQCAKRRFCGGCRAVMWQTTGYLRATDVACPAKR